MNRTEMSEMFIAARALIERSMTSDLPASSWDYNSQPASQPASQPVVVKHQSLMLL